MDNWHRCVRWEEKGIVCPYRDLSEKDHGEIQDPADRSDGNGLQPADRSGPDAEGRRHLVPVAPPAASRRISSTS